MSDLKPFLYVNEHNVASLCCLKCEGKPIADILVTFPTKTPPGPKGAAEKE